MLSAYVGIMAWEFRPHQFRTAFANVLPPTFGSLTKMMPGEGGLSQFGDGLSEGRVGMLLEFMIRISTTNSFKSVLMSTNFLKKS